MDFNFIDVGSRGQLHKRWKGHINNIITIDPSDQDGTETITECYGKRFHYTNAIFDTEETRKFFVCKKSRVSSLFEPNLKAINETCYRKASYNFNVEKVIDIYCIRLDTILETLPVIFNFLKVDAQGADLNVLKSMGKFLNNLRGIEVECNKVRIYKEIPLENDIIEYLKEHNFELFKKIPPSGEKSKVWNDCVFINKNLIPKKTKLIKEIYS